MRSVFNCFVVNPGSESESNFISKVNGQSFTGCLRFGAGVTTNGSKSTSALFLFPADLPVFGLDKTHAVYDPTCPTGVSRTNKASVSLVASWNMLKYLPVPAEFNGLEAGVFGCVGGKLSAPPEYTTGMGTESVASKHVDEKQGTNYGNTVADLSVNKP